MGGVEQDEVEQEEVLWPAPGVEVRVGKEELLTAARMGDHGISEGTCPGSPNEVLVRFTTKGSLTSVRVPRSILVPEGLRPLMGVGWGSGFYVLYFY